MTLLNQEDRGIEAGLNGPEVKDQDRDGVIEDGLGDPAAPEDAGTGGAGGSD